MKFFSFIMKAAAVIMIISAALAALYVFRDRIEEMMETAYEKYESSPLKKRFSQQEVDDFADLD